jgi:flagellar hook-length control protein FliK
METSALNLGAILEGCGTAPQANAVAVDPEFATLFNLVNVGAPPGEPPPPEKVSEVGAAIQWPIAGTPELDLLPIEIHTQDKQPDVDPSVEVLQLALAAQAFAPPLLSQPVPLEARFQVAPNVENVLAVAGCSQEAHKDLVTFAKPPEESLDATAGASSEEAFLNPEVQLTEGPTEGPAELPDPTLSRHERSRFPDLTPFQGARPQSRGTEFMSKPAPNVAKPSPQRAAGAETPMVTAQAEVIEAPAVMAKAEPVESLQNPVLIGKQKDPAITQGQEAASQAGEDGEKGSFLFGKPQIDEIHEEAAPKPDSAKVAAATAAPAAQGAKPSVAPSERPVTPDETNRIIRQVADRIQLLAAARPRAGVTIKLMPQDLGAITLNVKNLGGEVQAQVTASNDQVRTALEQNAAQLGKALEARGLTLGKMEFSPGTFADSTPHGQQAPHQQRMHQPPNSFEVAGGPRISIDDMRQSSRKTTGVDLWI